VSVGRMTAPRQHDALSYDVMFTVSSPSASVVTPLNDISLPCIET
jgi:hypothetical protein